MQLIKSCLSSLVLAFSPGPTVDLSTDPQQQDAKALHSDWASVGSDLYSVFPD